MDSKLTCDVLVRCNTCQGFARFAELEMMKYAEGDDFFFPGPYFHHGCGGTDAVVVAVSIMSPTQREEEWPEYLGV